MFILTQQEFQRLRSQIVTSKKGGTRYLSYAFTEQGVAMLSNVLNREKAIEVNIAINRTFILIRQQITGLDELSKKIKQLEKKYNKNFKEVFAALDFLIIKNKQRKILKIEKE